MRKADFDAVYRNGKRRSSSHFTVFLKANELPESRFGFSIKRALGGAVVRNRMRRRIREVIRLHREEISAGWDFVIHPKSNVENAPFAVLEKISFAVPVLVLYATGRVTSLGLVGGAVGDLVWGALFLAAYFKASKSAAASVPLTAVR